MNFTAKKAVRTKRPLKVSLEGLSGSGKTYTALRLAFDMRRNGIGSRVVVLDSENGSASLYADVTEDGERWEFDTVDLVADVCHPAGYAEAYRWAVKQGYDLVIFDSLSHAWHGALEQVDAMAGAKGDKFRAWASVTPQQRDMIQTLTDPRANCIVTMRVKSEYEHGTGPNGKAQIKKVGVKADQRENTEYEFDLVLRFEQGNECRVEKVRGCSALNGKTATRPGPQFWRPLFDWWKGGAELPAPAGKTPAPDPASVKELYDRLHKINAPESGERLAKGVEWADAQLGRLLADHPVGDLKASVVEFLKLSDLEDLTAVKHQQDLTAGWNHCRQFVGNCVPQPA